MTGTGIYTKGYLGHCYLTLGQYDKAAEASKTSKNYYYYAHCIAKVTDDPVLQYNAYKDALLKKKLAVSQANNIFNKLAELDLEDSDITKKALLKTYRSIRKKYKTITKVDGKNVFVYDEIQAQLDTLMADLKTEIAEDAK